MEELPPFEYMYSYLNPYLASYGLSEVYTEHKTKSKPFRLVQSIFFACSQFNLASTLLCEGAMLVYLLSSISLDNFLYFSETLACILYSSTAFIKALWLSVGHKKVKAMTAILKTMYEAEWDDQEKEIIREAVMPTRRLLSAYCLETAVTAFAYGVMQFVTGLLDDGGGMIPMPYGFLYPFDPASSMSLYVFLYIAQIYAGFQVTSQVATFDSIFCNVVTHMSMHFDIICHRLQKIGSHDDDEDDNRIKGIVMSHGHLLDLCEDANSIFGFAMLYNITMNSVMNCNLMLSILIAPASVVIKYVLLLFSSCLQLFILSYYGEKLKTSSSNIVYACYNSSWLNAKKRTRQSLLMIQAKGLRCESLSAFGFTDVSMITFMNVLKVSMSYFTLMKQMYYAIKEGQEEAAAAALHQ